MYLNLASPELLKTFSHSDLKKLRDNADALLNKSQPQHNSNVMAVDQELLITVLSSDGDLQEYLDTVTRVTTPGAPAFPRAGRAFFNVQNSNS